MTQLLVLRSLDDLQLYSYLITSNAGLTAIFVHIMLWNYNEIKLGWAFANMANFRKLYTPSTYAFWRY